jgi:ribose transport system substrate-binding protein
MNIPISRGPGSGNHRIRRRSRRGMCALITLATVALLASACGGTSSSPSSSAPTQTPSTASSSSSAVDPVVAKAKEFLAQSSMAQTVWAGPTTGPAGLRDKRIAFITCGSFSPVCIAQGELVTAAAAKLGWKVTTLDGQGTVAGWLDAFNQAISSNVDGIIDYGVTTSAIPTAIASAKEAGIPIVSMAAGGTSGANPADGVFYDPTPNACAMGDAFANYAIADSNGTARVVWESDTAYDIATAKSDCFQKTMATCSTCDLLEVANSPLATWAKDGASVVLGWLNKYGPEPFYFGSVADFVFPGVIPAVKAAGKTPADIKMFGSDGGAASYESIRKGDDFIVATFPQPINEMAYLAVDGMNRALSNEPPQEYTPAPYTVIKGNVDIQGGKNNEYIPDYNFEQEILKIWGVS